MPDLPATAVLCVRAFLQCDEWGFSKLLRHRFDHHQTVLAISAGSPYVAHLGNNTYDGPAHRQAQVCVVTLHPPLLHGLSVLEACMGSFST